jgi:DNA-binding CsgD family transcriptional regulator
LSTVIQDRHVTLTPRQQKALARQIDGQSSADTGGDFGVGASAIRMRRKRAMAKLDAEQRARIKRYVRALRRGGHKHTIRPIQLSLVPNT